MKMNFSIDPNYKSGRLQKIFSSRIETGICNASKNLNWDEIAINKENIEEIGLELPLEARYVPRSLEPNKRCTDNTFKRKIVNPAERLEIENDSFVSQGYAIISEYDNYYKEMLEEKNVILSIRSDVLDFELNSIYDISEYFHQSRRRH